MATYEGDAEYENAVKSGDREKALSMLRDKADKELNTIILPDDKDTKGFKCHLGKAPTNIHFGDNYNAICLTKTNKYC